MITRTATITVTGNDDDVITDAFQEAFIEIGLGVLSGQESSGQGDGGSYRFEVR